MDGFLCEEPGHFDLSNGSGYPLVLLRLAYARQMDCTSSLADDRRRQTGAGGYAPGLRRHGGLDPLPCTTRCSDKCLRRGSGTLEYLPDYHLHPVETV